MIAGFATEIFPMPKPIPQVLVAHCGLGAQARPDSARGTGAPRLRSATAGAVLAVVLRGVTVAKGIGYGVVLWALMGLAWLPYLGWGLFGTGITARIAAATLLLHLVYGTTLGLLLDRGRAR